MSDEQISSFPNVVYTLDVRAPDSPPQRIAIEDYITVGSSVDTEVCLEDYKLAPKHCIFRVHNEVLSVHNVGGDEATHIGNVSLMQGKMYIVDKGDKVRLGDIEILIRKEDVESESSYRRIIDEQSVEDTEEDEEENIQEIIQRGSEQLHEDEEDEKESRTFISRIFKVKKGKEKQKAHSAAPKLSGKGSKVKLSPKDAPSFLTRIYATVFTLSLAYCAYYFVLPLIGLDGVLKSQIDKVYVLISPHIEAYINATLGKQLLLYFALYWALEIIGHFVFATPIPYFLLGIYHQGSIVGQRIKGVLRLVFSLITTPFLIFDLPTLIGKRPLKEVLSGTYYKYGKGSIKAFGLFILFPLGIIACLYSPLLNYPDFYEGINLKEIQALRLKKKEKSLPLLEASSSVFNFNVKAPDLKKAFLFPTFAIKRVKKGKNKSARLEKGVILLHQSKDLKVSLKIELPIPYDEILKFAKDGNPLFDVFQKYLSDQSTKNGKAKTHLRDSLQVGLPKLLDITKRNGPFINGLLSTRSYLIDKFSLSPNSNIEWLSTAAGDFIFLEDLKKGKKTFDYILHLKNDSISPMKLEYNGKSKVLAKTFKNKILKYAIPYKKKKNAKLIWNALSIIDFIKDLERGKELPIETYNSFFDFTFNKVGNALGNNNERYAKGQMDYLENILEALSFTNDNKRNSNSIALIYKLRQLSKAVKNGDSDFFLNPNINVPQSDDIPFDDFNNDILSDEDDSSLIIPDN